MTSHTLARRICFVGLGAMGAPMAGHLVARGFAVTVFNRSSGKVAAWVEQNPAGRGCFELAEAVADADVVAMCVGNDADVRSTVTAALPHVRKGAVFVDHTTTSAQVARELAAITEACGASFLDAPVSGGEIGARNGQLTVMCGGTEEVFQRVLPVVSSYAKAVTLLGPSGSGQLAKMVNQICIAGLVQGLAEAVRFGQHAGLDMNAVLDVIGKGAAQSWQMDNRGKTMVADKFDFGFAVDWMRKDLGLVLDEAKRNGARLPVTALVDQFYADVQAEGGGRWDTSSLIKRL
jgi:3-hydroxyisobutyrate dehydrogenase-like beta-hydroxyacid dehydrogenase